ncbi:MAG TPA: FkbM family methyltransferase [Caulobacteraceae bacterium]
MTQAPFETSRTLQLAGRAFEICGRPGDPYFENVALDGSNDFLAWFCANRLARDAVVFDVGANIGVTAVVFAATVTEGAIWCFEPSPAVYPCLLQTLGRNGLDRCRPLPLALGAAPGRLAFYDNPTSASASHLVAGDQTLGPASDNVDVSTIDRVVQERGLERLDLIKIDVEGFETEVLEGAERTLAALKPTVYLEFNSFTLIAYGNRNPRQFLEELLARFDFVYRFEAGAPRQISGAADVLDFIHDNLVKHGCVDDLLCCFEPLP